MIKKCINEFDKEEVEKYIGNEYFKCLYLYMDLKKYGVNFDGVETWIQYDGNITAVFLKYYDGIHIYSKDKNFDITELSNFILSLKPNVICAEKSLVLKIKKYFLNSGYFFEAGWVRKLEKAINEEVEFVEKAQNKDFLGIAKLIYNDEDIGSFYDYEKLKDQMYERNKQGFVRNYVIRKDESIIAHAGTGAEYEQIAIMNYVVTDKNYRNKRFGDKSMHKIV